MPRVNSRWSPLRVLAYAAAGFVSLLCLYPYWWMLVSAFRSTEAILSAPLRPWPEAPSLQVLSEVASIGGTMS
jgi:ABC-type glycerol-3-phosphate transport system permease component